MSNTTTYQAWPFLVGKSNHIGYQTIAAPLPWCKAHVENFLAFAASSEDDEPVPAHIHYREIKFDQPSHDSYALIYRFIYADKSILGEDNLEKPVDENYRPIQLTEGWVVRNAPETPRVNEESFVHLHNSLKECYQVFWKSQDDPFNAIPTAEASIDASTQQNSALPLDVLRPYVIRKPEPLSVSPAPVAQKPAEREPDKSKSLAPADQTKQKDATKKKTEKAGVSNNVLIGAIVVAVVIFLVFLFVLIKYASK